MSLSDTYRESSSDEPVIVGIGASAGGIEALTEFFKQVKPDSGLAYVVILHLSPDHDSQLAQILQMVASVTVTQVTQTVKVAANNVYVVPPNKHLQMVDSTIKVVANTHVDERRAPVDIFFRTLAETHGQRAIAVILSGTGANGSMGLKRIKENGGGVFVQNPREAAFSEMPRHAIATDLVDEVLPVAQIPARLKTYRQSLGTIDIPVEALQRTEAEQQALREVFSQLRLRTGHDFSNYKRPTLLRRLARRVHVRDLPDLPAYVAFLRENPDEVQALLKDLLISVTNFFRDATVFTALEQEVIQKLISEKKAGDTLRAWVAGCATGEEAYSMAMLLAEYSIGVLDAPDIQIFATDIDEEAIAAAREGLYTLNDAADVSPERLRRFFTKEGDEYRVRREIREMILFANHNVLKDPPFSRLDLVSCRNLLIYLNQSAQERVLETFHFSLNPGGYLVLGPSETIDGANDLYTTISREHHLYRSRKVAARPYPLPEGIPKLTPERKPPPAAVAEDERRLPLRLNYGELHQQLLEQYAPPSIIVNEEYDILHLSDRAGRYLHIAGGEPTQNLLKLILPELRLELRTAFIQATQRQINVDVRNLTIRISDKPETITIHVRPVLQEKNTGWQGYILVIFEPQSTDSAEPDKVITSVEPVAQQLEEELIRVKAQLRASNEHHELQAEALKASNEELQAMNEELRSAAEELETGKEELQSINEELITVNQELKIKVEEISITSSNLQNLINSTDIATLFLDRNLRINLFTPPARHLFNLIPTDYGRPLTDITNRLDDQHLFADAAQVLETLQPVEREVRTLQGRTFLMRVSPYRTTDDHVRGVVVTFVDMTERKAAAEAQRKSEEQFRLFVTASSDTIYKMSADWRQMINLKGGTFLTDTDSPSISWLDQYIPLEDRPEVENAIQKAIQDRQTFELEHRVIQIDGSIGWTFSRAVPVLDEQGAIREWFGAASDITQRKQAEIALQESEEKYRTLFDSIDEGFCIVEMVYDETGVATDYRFVEVNQSFERQTGVTNIVGKLGKEHSPDTESYWVRLYDQVAQTGESIRFEEYHQATNRWYESYASRVGKPESRRVAVVFDDVSERKRREVHQQYLLTLSDALRPLADPNKIQLTAMHVLGTHLKVHRAFYSELVEDGDTLLIGPGYADTISPLEGYVKFTEFDSDLLEHYRKGQTVVINDLYVDVHLSPQAKAAFDSIQVRAAVGVPLVKEGKVRAILSLHQSEPRQWTADEIALLEETAERTWAAVEQARAEEELRKSEEQKTLLLNLGDALREMGDPLEIQQLAMQMLGEFLGLSRAYYFHAESDADGWVHIIDSAYQRDPGGPSMIGRHSLKPFGNQVFDDFDKGEIIAVSDINTLSMLLPEELAVYQAINVTAFINVPLLQNGRYSAGVAVHDTKPRAWTADEIDLIREVAVRMWTFVERALAEEALRVSEEWLSGIINQATAGIAQGELDGTLTFVNQKYGEILGYDPAELVGQKMQSFTHPEDLERNMKLFNRLGQTGEPFDIEKRYIRKDGTLIWVHNSVSALRNADGNITQLIAVSVDISDRKRAEMALAISEEKYRTLFESIDEGVATLELIFDENERAVDFRYLEHNVALTRQIGLTSAIIGKRVSEIFPYLEKYWIETYERVVKTGDSERHDYYFATLDSWFDIFISRVDGSDSRKVVCVYNSITERKRAEERQAFLLKLSDALRSLQDPIAIQKIAMEVLGEHMGVNRAYYSETQADSDTLLTRTGYFKDVASMVGSLKISDFDPKLRRMYLAGETVVLQDVYADMELSDRSKSFSESIQFRAGIDVPILKEGKLAAIMTVHQATPRQWKENEIALFREVAERIWVAIERAKAEAVLRDFEQRMASIRPLILLGQTEELANIGSWEYNRQTGQFNWSDGMYKLFDIELGRPVQLRIYEAFALEEDRDKAQRLVTYLRKGEGQFEADLRIRVNGMVKTLRIKAGVIGEGIQQRVLGVDLDITGALAAQQQIQETAENLQAVLDGSPAAIGLLKPIRDPADATLIVDFRLAVGNRKLAEFLNKSLKKLLNQSAGQFSELLWGSQTVDTLRQVRLTGETRYEEQQLPTNGRWLGIAITRQDDGVLITALDITQLKTVQDQQQHWLSEVEASRQNVDALGELRESLRHRAELLRAVSHDLRGNFGIISGTLELLSMAVSEAERAHMMEMVLRNVKQATSMLTELLDYSRLESGQEQLTIESFDVTSLLQELSQSLQAAADEQGLRLESSGPDTLRVEGDRLHVYRMAQNLTINAIKYTHKGQIIVKWGMDANQTEWWFSVTDTGPGIDSELVDRLNDNSDKQIEPAPLNVKPVLVRTETKTSWTKLRGEGIGLRIVRQLAQLLKAKLEVSSEAGVGTQFVVRFSRRPD